MNKLTSLPIVYVKPGEIYFSRRPEIISTVLGSCVAVIMYEPEKGIRAVSHSVLPSAENYPKEKGKSDYKFVDRSIEKMLGLFDKNNISRSRIIVKLFGGAEQLDYENKRNSSIGKQNVLKAIEMLENEGLNIVAMDVGGNAGRKIYLMPDSGEVFLSRLGNIKKTKAAGIL